MTGHRNARQPNHNMVRCHHPLCTQNRMLRRQHLLSGLTVLVVCLIAFVYNKSHTESVSLAQDGPSHSECLSSVEKMMKALDFSSLREYEDHVLSTGKALPCGLRSHSTAQNITHRVVLSHEHKQTLWSMIFGNFFDNDSDEKKTPDGSQKQIKTISSSLPSGAQRKDHHTIAATRANSSLLEQHSSHLHLDFIWTNYYHEACGKGPLRAGWEGSLSVQNGSN